MGFPPEFIVNEQGVLTEYTGNDTKLIIPQGIKVIGSEAFQKRWFKDHTIEEITHIIIPDGVKKIELGAFGGMRVIHLEMSLNCPTWPQQGMAKVYGFARSLLRCSGSSITFRNADSEKVAFVVLANEGETEPKQNGAILSIKSTEGKFDFTGYDDYFASLAKAPNKVRIAMARLEYPYELSEEMETVYMNYLKRQAVVAGSIAIDSNDLKSLEMLVEKKLLTANSIKKLIEYAKTTGNTEITAWLLNYANEFSMLKDNTGSELSLKTDARQSENSDEIPLAEIRKLYKFKYVSDGVVITGYKGNEKIIRIPEKIAKRTVIGLESDAFDLDSGKDKIEKIIVPGSIKTFQRCCFSVSNAEIEFCEGITQIPMNLFNQFDLSNLTVRLPNSLQYLGHQIFTLYNGKESDRNAIHFIVPEGSYAEKRCKELDYFYTAIHSEPLKDESIEDKTGESNKTESNTEEQKKPKKGDKEWKKPKVGTHYISRYLGDRTDIVFPSEVEGISITGIANTAGDTPNNYRKLVSVELPEGYTYIGNKAFAGCVELKRIILPSTITEIGTQAFAGCKNLQEIVLNGDILFTGNEPFYDSDIKTVIFENVKGMIKPRLFFHCRIQNFVVVDGDFKSRGCVFDTLDNKDFIFPEKVYTDGLFHTMDMNKNTKKHMERIHQLDHFDASEVLNDRVRSKLMTVKARKR